MDDLSVAMETTFGLQDVKALDKVDGKSLLQEQSLGKGLEGLSVHRGSNCLYEYICNVVKINQ